ncbi:MAG: Si-specific NAD(P)(+) transhydrogenase [Deltaproteobacteria bacterium]|nr:MAG: Si-specific NAD(P)(+) transhydrogenase [Deltaproteobacteria bacterium]
MARYDLVVIGSGPAGEKGAAQAAWSGKRVAMVEKRAPHLGGACTNTGTLPSKTLRESALALTGMTSRGLEAAVLALPRPFAAATLMFREHLVVSEERARIWRNMERHGVEMFAGSASFVDPHTVRIAETGQTIPADFFLIATGSRPHRPSWVPFEEPEIYDSDEILEIETIPESMIVMGSGVIAAEYACIFAALGTKVILLDGRDRLLSFLDEELGDRFTTELERLGLWLRLGDAPAQCSLDPQTRVCTVVTEKGRVETAAAVLGAAGRSGNTSGLGLEALGVIPDKRGNLPVNEHFQTAQPHIYAAGDVVGFPGLASTSMEQGRVAMCHAFQIAYKTRVNPLFPYGIYTIPEISYVGPTEEELKGKGVDYLAGRALMRENARGEILGAESGFLKLLFAPDKKLLAVHALGPSATELIHIGVIALLKEATIDLFIDAVFNYPTLSELYKYAAYDGLGALARRGKGA